MDMNNLSPRCPRSFAKFIAPPNVSPSDLHVLSSMVWVCFCFFSIRMQCIVRVFCQLVFSPNHQRLHYHACSPVLYLLILNALLFHVVKCFSQGLFTSALHSEKSKQFFQVSDRPTYVWVVV